MKHRITDLLLVAEKALTCAFGAAQAEKPTAASPANIEADALRHDEVKQTSVFSGRVVMIKGAPSCCGARLDVRQDADGYQSGIVTLGRKPRVLPPKRDTLPGAPRNTLKAKGEVIEYDDPHRQRALYHPRRAAPLPGRCPERRNHGRRHRLQP